MKAILAGCCIIALLALISGPLEAQEDLVLYDDFEGKFLTPDKWLCGEASTPAIAIQESSRQIKKEPVYGYKGLNILNRARGATSSNSGTYFTATRLTIPDGSAVETIQATIQVKRIEAVGCSGNLEPTEVRARMSGYFFNTDVPEPGSALNDVQAFIMVRRLSNSDAAAKVLDVIGLSGSIVLMHYVPMQLCWALWTWGRSL